MFLRPSLSQSQSGDCCNAVSCSAAWHSCDDVSRVTSGMGHTALLGHYLPPDTVHSTGDDDDPQICAAIGVLKTFSCFLNIPNINIFRTWQSSEQSSVVCGQAQAAAARSMGRVNQMLIGRNLGISSPYRFPFPESSMVINAGVTCTQPPCTTSPLTPNIGLFRHTAGGMKTWRHQGAKVSLFQIRFPADHLIIITNYRLPWKWNWMSRAHNNTLLGI